MGTNIYEITIEIKSDSSESILKREDIQKLIADDRTIYFELRRQEDNSGT